MLRNTLNASALARLGLQIMSGKVLVYILNKYLDNLRLLLSVSAIGFGYHRDEIRVHIRLFPVRRVRLS